MVSPWHGRQYAGDASSFRATMSARRGARFGRPKTGEALAAGSGRRSFFRDVIPKLLIDVEKPAPEELATFRNCG